MSFDWTKCDLATRDYTLYLVCLATEGWGQDGGHVWSSRIVGEVEAFPPVSGMYFMETLRIELLFYTAPIFRGYKVFYLVLSPQFV